jgi:hypothetical protein
LNITRFIPRPITGQLVRARVHVVNENRSDFVIQ